MRDSAAFLLLFDGPFSSSSIVPEAIAEEGLVRAMDLENGVLGSIFVPDIITPAQFYDMRRDDGAIAPVRRLMMAVLEDALRCFQNNASAHTGLRRKLFEEAEQWLCRDHGDGPFAFDTVCETLGIEPQYLRAGLIDWRQQQLGGSARRRLARRSPVVRSGKVSAAGRRSNRRRVNQVN